MIKKVTELSRKKITVDRFIWLELKRKKEKKGKWKTTHTSRQKRGEWQREVISEKCSSSLGRWKWIYVAAHFSTFPFLSFFFNFPFPTFIHRHTNREKEREYHSETHKQWTQPLSLKSTLPTSLCCTVFHSPRHTQGKKKSLSHSLTSSFRFVSNNNSVFRVFNWELNWTELNWNGFPRLQARNYWNSVGLRLFFWSQFLAFALSRSFALSLVRFFFLLSLSLSFVEWLTGEWSLETWIRRGREAEVWERSRRGEDRAAVVSAKNRRN